MNRRLLMVGFAAVALAAAAGAARAQQTAQAPVVMRISHQVPTAHHLHKMLEGFAADVKQRTNGQVEVQIFPAEQAHKAAENHPAVARGAIEAATAVNFQWGNTIPEMSVTVIPYFFTDLERIKRFPGSPAAQLLEKELERRGVKNLMWLYITRQSIFTSGKAPIVNVGDFKGLKIRGLNPLADKALSAAGAAPSAMPGSEVYQALQSGVLDAGLTDLSAAVSRRFYEVQKYGTVTPYFSVFFHVYVNPAWWNKLSPAHRSAIEAAAKKAEETAIGVTEETAAQATRQLREKGMTIHAQTPEQITQWKAVMQKPVMDEFLRLAPKNGAKLIELIDQL